MWQELEVREGTAIASAPNCAEVRMHCKDVIRVRVGDVEVEGGGDVSPATIEAVLRTLGER